VIYFFCDFSTIRWNNLSWTIPEELGIFSDTLQELNFSGGSITGTIPSSLGRLSKLENLSLSDNCLTGSIPEGLDSIPSLSVVVLYSNNLLSGSLEPFCETPLSLREGTIVVAIDASIDCSCCISCEPDQFECTNPLGHVTYSTFTVQITQFQKECLSSLQQKWIAEECPCVTNISSFQGKCNDCTALDARPST
jgi:hypothetical protein